MNATADFTVDRSAPRTAVFSGVIRLESRQAYERLLGPIQTEIVASSETYTLDFSRVVFMNSSGIHAVGKLVLAAKTAGTPLRVQANGDSPWQKKTFASLRLLYEKLDLVVEGGS